MLSDEEADVVAEPSKYLNVHAHENNGCVFHVSCTEVLPRCRLAPCQNK
jgi:hypothetical protein